MKRPRGDGVFKAIEKNKTYHKKLKTPRWAQFYEKSGIYHVGRVQATKTDPSGNTIAIIKVKGNSCEWPKIKGKDASGKERCLFRKNDRWGPKFHKKHIY